MCLIKLGKKYIKETADHSEVIGGRKLRRYRNAHSFNASNLRSGLLRCRIHQTVILSEMSPTL